MARRWRAADRLAQIRAEVHQRVEAIDLAGRIVAWAEGAGVRAPILRTLAGGILSGRPSEALVNELMTEPT